VLLELMLALGLASITFLSARAALETLDDARGRLARESARIDALRNGERLLVSLIGDIEPMRDSASRFAGDGARIAFATWCEAAGGWLEQCRGELTLSVVGDSAIVRGIVASVDTLTLLRVKGRARFLYRDPADSLGDWQTTWGTTIALPRAVAVATDRDTLLLPIWSAQ
jgi:hypothetical protein